MIIIATIKIKGVFYFNMQQIYAFYLLSIHFNRVMMDLVKTHSAMVALYLSTESK